MNFCVKERLAWVRTSTHTVINDHDPDFDAFREDPTGQIYRNFRIWIADSKDDMSTCKIYVGSVVLGSDGFTHHELMRVFRRVASYAEATKQSKFCLRRRMIHLLRAKSHLSIQNN